MEDLAVPIMKLFGSTEHTRHKQAMWIDYEEASHIFVFIVVVYYHYYSMVSIFLL